MSIPIFGTLTNECQMVRNGTILRLFKNDCTTQLKKWDTSGVVEQIPRSTLKTNYIVKENSEYIEVCPIGSPDKFAKKHYMFRIPVRIKPKCPFFGHEGILMRVTSKYGELTNPTNGVDVTLVEDISWTGNVSRSFTIGPLPGDPFPDFGSTYTGSWSLNVQVIDPDPLNPCVGGNAIFTATWLSFGQTPQSPPIPIVQQRFGCQKNEDGSANTLTFIWSGLYFAGGPIGLVMVLEASITFPDWIG